MKLIVVKTGDAVQPDWWDAVQPDWWIIERAEHEGREWEEHSADGLSAWTMRSARFVDGDVEGPGYEMRGLAQAIEQEGKATFKRCRVSWMATGCLIAPGQICRDVTCKTFRIAIVLGPSLRGGNLRVCRWHPSSEPQGGHWCSPCTRLEHQLVPITSAFDLSSRRGQVVAAARRSVVGGLVRWQVSPRHSGDKLTEVHDVGVVRP